MSEDITEVDSILDISLSKMSEVCRLCLSMDGSKSPIFADDHNENDPLSYKILACVSVEVSSNDVLSTLICQSCLKHVNDWAEFKKLCDSAQVKQREWLGKLRGGTSDDDVVTVKIEPLDDDEYVPQVLDEEFFAPVHSIKQEDIDICEEELQIEPITSHDPLSFNPRIVKREVYSSGATRGVRRDQMCVESYDIHPSDGYDETVEANVLTVEFGEEPEAANVREVVFKKTRKDVKYKGFYKCLVCSKQFATSSLYRRHQRIHTGMRYQCRFCPVVLGSNSSLHRHQRLHTGSKPFTCVTCNTVLPNRSAYWKHRAVCTGTQVTYKHQEQQQQVLIPKIMHVPLTCKVCNMTFHSKAGLLSHMTSHNRTCRWCKRTFSSRIGLSNHMKVHTTYGRSTVRAARKYRCKLCPEVFSNWSQIVKHRVVHVNNDNPTAAQQKSTQSSNIEALNAPHTCKICSETFSSWRDLIIHQKCHARQVPKKTETAPKIVYPVLKKKPRRYYCRACPDYFKSWYDLVKHRKQDHGGNGQSMVSSNKPITRTLPNPLSKPTSAVERLKVDGNVPSPASSVSSQSATTSTPSEGFAPKHSNVSSPGFCHVCGYDFRTSYALERHSAKHTNLKRYSCYICNARMKYGTSVQNHLKSVHGVIVDHRSIVPDASYNLAQSKVLAQITRVQQEGGRASPAPNIKCDPCKQGFLSQKQLVAHQQQYHNDPEQVKCESCFQVFISDADLNHHKQHCHSKIQTESVIKNMTKVFNRGSSVPLFSCSVCPSRFSSRKAWRNHQRLKNHWDNSEIKIRIFSCTECNNSYNSASALHEHKTTVHTQDTPTPVIDGNNTEQESLLSCYLCFRRFKSSIALKIHNIRAHRGARKTKWKKTPSGKVSHFVRTYNECDLCGKVFTNENALKTHRGWHSRQVGGKTLRSEQSDVGPDSVNNTVSPEVTQDQVKEMTTCPICDRTFSTVQAYKMHYQWHLKNPKNSSVPVSAVAEPEQKNSEKICEFCGKTFYRAKAYEIHYNWHLRNPSSLPTSSPELPPPSPLDSVHISEPISVLESDRESELEAHGTEMAANEELPCNLCGKPFYSERALKIHYTWHMRNPASLPSIPAFMEEGENMCQLCRKIFPNQKSFKIHYAWHLRIPNNMPSTVVEINSLGSPVPKQQSYSGNTVQARKEVSTANAIIDRSIPDANDFGEFDCEFCDKSCTTVQALRCHMGWHTRQGLSLSPKPIGRIQDDRAAQPPKEVSEANIRSDVDGTYTCNICDQTFKTIKACISHQGWHTRNVLDKNFLCEHCHKKFSSRGNLTKHQRLSCTGTVQWNGNPGMEGNNIPRVSVGTMSAPVFGKRGPNTGKGDFSCDVCHKGFKYLKAVATHKLLHHQSDSLVSSISLVKPSPPLQSLPPPSSQPVISPPAQPVIEQEGMQKPSNSRVGAQTGSNKKFSCDVCSQRFIGQKALTIHRNLHFRGQKGTSRLNPFLSSGQTHSCTICHKTFISRAVLSRHRQEHVRKMFRKQSRMPVNKVKTHPLTSMNVDESHEDASEVSLETVDNSTKQPDTPPETKTETSQLSTLTETSQLSTPIEINQVTTLAEISQVATPTEPSQLGEASHLTSSTEKSQPEISQVATPTEPSQRGEASHLTSSTDESQPATSVETIQVPTPVEESQLDILPLEDQLYTSTEESNFHESVSENLDDNGIAILESNDVFNVEPIVNSETLIDLSECPLTAS